MGKKIGDEIVKEIIKDIETTDLGNKDLSEKYGISVSTIEKINQCKVYTHLHNYINNIRSESHGKLVRVLNDWYEKDDYMVLKITNTKKETAEVLIDKEDYEKLSQYSWSIKLNEQNVYRVRCTTALYRGKELHQILLDYDDSYVCDHINRNPLDNRKANLRIVTHSVNSTNAKARKESSSQIRGVYRREARPGIAKAAWICEWSEEGKRHSKSFSVAKYGEDGAFELAKSLREEKMKEMKIQSVPVEISD